jgi:hypothetical protein
MRLKARRCEGRGESFHELNSDGKQSFRKLRRKPRITYLLERSLVRDAPLQFLKIMPTVGQFDQNRAFTNVLSFGDDLAPKPFINASRFGIFAQNLQGVQ